MNDFVCPRRGRGKTVCVRGAWVSLLGDPSTSPMGITETQRSRGTRQWTSLRTTWSAG